nr:cyclodeaminase/cyclohydrolase family protein [Tissierella sp.]
MYIDKSIREYINVVQSGDPTPGGGSVCSLVTSLGGALTLMTSNFSIDKPYFKELKPEIQEEIKKNHDEIKKAIERINELIDEDARGFASVINAYNEKDESEDPHDRDQRIQESYRKALLTPLNCSRECLKMLKLQESFVDYGNKDTITDVGVGVILVYAALEGSLISVKINLNYIEDRGYTEKIEEEIKQIYKESSKIKRKLTEKVDKKLEGN